MMTETAVHYQHGAITASERACDKSRQRIATRDPGEQRDIANEVRDGERDAVWDGGDRRAEIAARRRRIEDAKAGLVALLRDGETLVAKLDACIDSTFEEEDALLEARK